MKFAFFQGCNIPVRIEQYAKSTQAVFKKFGVDLVEVRDFNCCGYPVRNVDEKAYILPSVRNMAVAEKLGMDIIVICNCCFASLMKAKNIIENDSQLKEELNLILAKEDLKYNGTAAIKHYLTVLYSDIGINTIAKNLVYKVKDLNVAVIQGCHVLRPREVTRFDNSFVPAITDSLVTCTGAANLEWQGKLECCGAALAGINDKLSHELLTDKVDGAKKAGANFITPICSYCHLQFDTTQRNITPDNQEILPVLLYPQLLGLCLGISSEELGIQENSTISSKNVESLKLSLGPPVEEKKKRKRKKKENV